MKHILSLLVSLLFAVSSVQAQETDFETQIQAAEASPASIDPTILLSGAASAYAQGDYAEAAIQFESLVRVFNGAPDIYYNLGNCYFKQGQYAKAILNYERCLRREPSHTDAQNNLILAQQNCIDKIDVIQPNIIQQWNDALRNSLTTDGWSRLSIGLFLAFLAGMAIFFFTRKVSLRKFGFYGGILLLILSFISMGYASSQADRLQSEAEAIVMSPTVTLRSEPNSGKDICVIHEGLKVQIRQELSGCYEVELADGRVGWMPKEQLARIWQN